MEPQMTGDEIVISGIAGKFPNSENIDEFQKNLLNKIDCTADSKVRWDFEFPHVPPRIGVLKNVDTFDRVFFGVHGRMADCMDPMIRMMLELTYEAITDAGINPKNLRGSKSAVFIGSCFSEVECAVTSEKRKQSGLNILGSNRGMLSNRLSFFFDLQGPSTTIDSSCCGGITALQEGFKAIKEGRAENAIIGACNVALHPQMSLQLFLLGLLSPDGITKSFDNTADGHTRSESIVVLFLQKARNAKRIYAEIKSARMSFGNINNDFSFFYPTHESQANLMKTTLNECGLSGGDISFVEADGSGIKDVDAEEVKAIDQAYNGKRNSPLLIGSVKSNIGSCSAANSLNGIIKVITAMESGHIPPNLNFKCPSDKIPALKNGRCKVVTEVTPWVGDYAVVNSLGLTGSSANVVLKAYKKYKKRDGKPEDNLPRLVICSGCTEEAVNFMLSSMESRPVDVEMHQLLYDVFETETPTHLYRGYTLLPSHGLPKIKTRETEYFTGFKKEIWYMFSGMGSQWVGMGEALLKIPVFAESMSKCDRILKPRGIDIVRIITEKDPRMFDNIVNSFVGIAAIQIGLVDLLSSIGLQPDYVIGHSVGELGCAYADGCFTAEQMILSALSRGLASLEAKLPKGSMAAVGLGYNEIKSLCPPDIDIACHNSADSSTISGPADSIKEFVAQLTANKIFAKEVASSNMAYHSRYIAPAGEKLRKYLQEIIPNPKRRSDRWISSSVPRDEWDSAKARLSSAEYHTNNLLSSVLFAESSKIISSNAIVIEIAPHGLLQAIVRKSLPKTVANVPLTKRDHADNVSFLFGALGKIYNAGCKISVSNLYPKVSYPVSRGTPSISPLIRWDHSTSWDTNIYEPPKEVKKGDMKFIIDLKDENWKYLKHVRIDGRVVVPTSVYLKLAWDVLKYFKNSSKLSLVYNDVKVHNYQVVIPENDKIVLVVMVQKGTGYFEVTNNKNLLCSGILQTSDAPNLECIQFPKKGVKDNQNLSENEVYTELQMRGLQYSGSFRTICKSSANGSNGTLVWKENWIPFLEGMIQMYVFGNAARNAQVPIKIGKIIINLKLHEETIKKSNEIPATVYRELNSMSAGGIQMEGIVIKSILCDSWKNSVAIEKHQIVSTTDGGFSNLSEIFNLTLQILNENSKISNMIHVVDDKTIDFKNIRDYLQNVLENTTQTTRFSINEVPLSWLLGNTAQSKDVALMVLCNIQHQTSNDLSNLTSADSFLLTFAETEQENVVLKTTDAAGLGLVLRKYYSKDRIALLLRRRQNFTKTCVLEINDDKDWCTKIRTKLTSKDCDRLIIAIRSLECFDLYKIVEVLQKEGNGKRIQIVEIQDPKVLKLSLEDCTFSSHMNLNLKMNILLPGKIWGMYGRFSFSPKLRYVSNWTAKQLLASELKTISWVEKSTEKNENVVKVEYAAVNEADILSAKTEVALEETEKKRLEMKSFGQEYSGIDSSGNRVMGISINGAFSNFILTDPNCLLKVPDNWSLEDAATIPLAYAVAYLALFLKGELPKKESVFVYNGACSIGQAIINIALNTKAQVFVGYANDNDKKCLKAIHPNLPENKIINTTGIFIDELLAQTESKGVDLMIYNSDDIRRIDFCMTAVKDKGNLIIIGNLKKAFDKSVGMRPFTREVALFSIIPTKLINLDVATKKKLTEMIKNGIATGIVQPLPRLVYSREMLKSAFIDGASKNVFEKIIVKVQPEDGNNKALAIPRFLCESKASYLIIEGLNDFGLELVDFLVARGAKNIIIASESKNTRAYSRHRVSQWKEYGVSVVVRSSLDTSHQQNIHEFFGEISALGKVETIFDLQRIDVSSRSNSKYLFTKSLFEEAKRMIPDLRQFIIFSTCKNITENVDDVLLREINLAKICQEKSNETFTGLLILLGPITGIAESRIDSKNNVPLLSFASITGQMDNIIGLNSSIVSVFYKPPELSAEKVENGQVIVEETERSSFEKYITSKINSTI